MKNAFGVCLITLLIISSCAKENATPSYGVFSFEKSLSLPGTCDEIYGAITGDISGWWDHSFSKKPYRFYIEAKPGGGFYEIFDESGDGILHATVIGADRGKLLRFEGPLGLAGRAVTVVTTYMFEANGTDSTTLKVVVHSSGEIDASLASIVENVWDHFIFERFKPYIEKGEHLSR